MVNDKNNIQELIPHRAPFLWVESILEQGDGYIITSQTFQEDLELFKGHYPNNPIVPGVLLCESVFQSGALLISSILNQEASPNMIPVLSRITKGRFKRQVFPGNTITIRVELLEKMASAWFLKGVVRVNNKIAVQVEFSCTLVQNEK